MATPSIQTLITQAQQVLNLQSSNEIRATLAAVLANANVGTPLNPNLTTQQLWDEFDEIVRQSTDDIMSIITDQMMRMVFSPPAPGGASADKQVIFNDGGVLAGDAGLVYNKTTDTLTAGSATITGDLTVDTSTLKVDSTNNRVGIGTPTPAYLLDIADASFATRFVATNTNNSAFGAGVYLKTLNGASMVSNATLSTSNDGTFNLITGTSADSTKLSIGPTGVFTFQNVGGVAGTAMTLNSTGLGVGTTNYIGKIQAAGLVAAADPTFGTSGTFIGAILNNDNTAPGLDLRRWTGSAANHGTTYISTDATGATFFYNGTQASNTKATSLKMTLDASGNLLVGTTAVGMTAGGVRLKNGGGNLGEITLSNNSGAADYVARFVWGSGATLVGNITVSSVATVYNTTSDYRLKESVKPLSGGLARVNALKPSVYNWKSDGSTGEGFLAHELAEVVPAAVTGEKDAVNADGTIKSQGIDMSRVVPILVAAIQELTAEVNALKNA